MSTEFSEDTTPLIGLNGEESGQIGQTYSISYEEDDFYINIEKKREYGAEEPEYRFGWPTDRGIREHLSLLEDLGLEHESEARIFYEDGSGVYETETTLDQVLSDNYVSTGRGEIDFSSVCASIVKTDDWGVGWSEKNECEPETSFHATCLDSEHIYEVVDRDRPEIEPDSYLDEMVDEMSGHTFPWKVEI